MFGLIGSYKDNYCCTIAYAVYMTISTIGGFYMAIEAAVLWLPTIISLLITLLAYSFARHIRMGRIRMAPVVFVCQPQSTVFMPSGPQYYSATQFNGQNQWQHLNTAYVAPQLPPPYTPQDPSLKCN